MIGSGRYNRLSTWCGAGLLGLLVAGCAPGAEDVTSVEEIEAVSATSISRHYYGYANPQTGEVRFSQHPIVLDEQGSRFGSAGYLVPNQFGEVPIVQDGVNGSNPPSTFEIQGVGAAVDDGAQSAGQSQCPGSNFILDIQLRHFFEKATFNDVFVEFTELKPGVTHYPYDTDSVPGGVPLDNSIGVYSYGTLSDANANQSTVTWKFERCTNEAFVFEFSVLGTCVPEPGETALSACRDNLTYNRVVAGEDTSCFKSYNGNLKCWGDNSFNQLPGVSGTESADPEAIVTAVDEATISVRNYGLGDGFGCAAMSTDEVKCWGSNSSGQLGDGTTISRSTPDQVDVISGDVLSNISQITAGRAHVCARSNRAEVQCWGDGSQGALGRGSTASSSYPVFVESTTGGGALQNVISVHAGGDSTCALLTSREVVCWGDNTEGQLGNGSTTDSSIPVYVQTATGRLTNVTALAMGDQHACAVSGSTLKCWGSNSEGQLGQGAGGASNSLIAVDVLNPAGDAPLSGARSVALGSAHSCATMPDARVLCWGRAGTLGDGGAAASSLPVYVSDAAGTGALMDVKRINARHDSTCAVTTQNNAYCWGANGSGQLGTGTTSNALRPGLVQNSSGTAALSSVSRMALGREFSCLVTSDGNSYCSGDNATGQLALGNTTSSVLPKITQLDVSPFTTLLRDVASVAAGDGHICALLINGEVRCWGDGARGALGNGQSSIPEYPVSVKVTSSQNSVLTGVTQIQAAYNSTCALIDTGEVMCWGQNSYGQLGDGTRSSAFLPTFVQLGSGNLQNILQVSMGYIHTCALNDLGGVYCWGFNRERQLGSATTDRVVLIPSEVLGIGGTGFLDQVVQISGGARHTCALREDSGVVCWGLSSRVGAGPNASSKVPPTEVLTPDGSAPLRGVVSISTHFNHTVALLEDGTLLAWGENDFGQLGDGTNINRLLPVPVLNTNGSFPLLNVRSISAGVSHTCAYMADRSVKCWGNGDFGQLGDGMFSSSFLPVDVNLD